MPSLGLIGHGYWGSKYPAALREMGISLEAVCTRNSHPDVPFTKTYHHYEDMLEDEDVDGVIIASPSKNHFRMAKHALEMGKHVLVEKPITTNYGEACHLYELAIKNKLYLMPGHIWLFNNSLREFKKHIDSYDVFYSKRLRTYNSADPRWELGVHDIYMYQWLFDAKAEDFKLSERGGGNIHHRFVKLHVKGKMINLEINTNYPFKTTHFFAQKNDSFVHLMDNEVVLQEKDIQLKRINTESQFSPLERQVEWFHNSIKDGREPDDSFLDTTRIIENFL